MFLQASFLISLITLSGGTEIAIVGGNEVKPHTRPFMVSIQFGGHHRCGGILIRQDFVLTVAHCLCLKKVSGSGQNFLEVVLGAHNITQNEKTQQRIEVKKYYPHPNYTKNNNDIMLLQLQTKAKLNNYVKVLTLPKKNEKIPANVKCSIAGWGMKRPKGTASDVLYEVTLKVQFNFECKNKWKDHFNSGHMICTVSDGKKAFCQGDSGGPLICDDMPVGLASGTPPERCVDRNYPEIYTKISAFLPWIKDVMNRNI
ncbi:granzyme B-like [Chanos chanos]|uniref:trypsin n=1 Tax=Chanos chanos TaxID=29144 RepID=A0A6J2WAV3_CHACN|nr:granzyme B-like [Chanos chanos]